MSNTLDRSPNQLMRELRGDLSPGEFAAAVRRAAREIGEHVSCDARYVGRIESGEIRCPNYAYERVFRHMFPGSSLQELGFAPRREVRRPQARRHPPGGGEPPSPGVPPEVRFEIHEENDDVHRRTFLTGGPAAVATALGLDQPACAEVAPGARVGVEDARRVEAAVHDIRLLDDAHGADGLFDRAGRALRTAYQLLNSGSYTARVEQRLQAAAGELAISVGWLAHDSGRLGEARSFYAEALATARMADDAALEAHSFCNSAFLARDAGRPREAVRAAQAAQQAARGLGSARLLSLLAMREAGGWAQLQDQGACERSLGLARRLFGQGPGDADPAWMSFYGEAELLGLESQCWSALGRWEPAAERARQAIELQQPHFVRNRALYTAELAHDQLGRGEPAAAAESGSQVVALFGEVRSTRIRSMVAGTAARLRAHRAVPEVADFLERYDTAPAC
ncbi:tetratricopeptide repeat protein [Streptacidiphilus sp. PB12-B1b]|uniref:tetratricopeptide repeat protein n=1 Tax=Streptacidiphilus sp. PB12-B1b TaxID=2705012 RepID=UPI0015F899DA|nr:tetratricopeptide repeat protein [Streptacidiphilus sp. PB12-B1b]QMU75428.1 tetratricopeptide repeat protein [Streptacidiphilus sp. PB12-B1b]